MVEKMIAEDMLEKLNWDNIPNAANIDPRFRGLAFDPNDEYFLSYMWGTFGILYNSERVETPDSWAVLWDEQHRKRIFMYDSMRCMMGVTAVYLGFDINTTEPSELEQVKNALISQMPLTLSYITDTVKDKMIGNEGDIAVVYSGDAIWVREDSDALNYAVPKEGSNIWFDGLVIPKGAKNKAEAEMFIDFLSRPDIAASLSEETGYTTANRAALDLIDPELRNDPIFWPSQDIIDRCAMFRDIGEFQREYDRIWNDVLTSGR
jgi:spermidine/putrescine transport system substrate-binding protein